MESTLTVTEAARNFSDLINRVVYCGDVAVLTRNGKPVARLVPEGPKKSTGRELAEFWRKRVPMSAEEAESFFDDLSKIRSAGNLPQRDPWAE